MSQNSDTLDLQTQKRGYRCIIVYMFAFILPYWFALGYFTQQKYAGGIMGLINNTLFGG